MSRSSLITENDSTESLTTSRCTSILEEIWDGKSSQVQRAIPSVIVFPRVNTRACNMEALIRHLIQQPAFGLSDYIWGYVRLEVPAQVFLSAVVATFQEFAVAAKEDPNGPGGPYAQRLACKVLYWITRYWRPSVDSDVYEELKSFIMDDVAPLFPKLATELSAALTTTSVSPSIGYSTTLRILRSHIPDIMPPLPTRFVYNNPYLLDLSFPVGVEEFSRQLTLVMSRAFRQAEPWEMVRSWNGRNSRHIMDVPERTYLVLSQGLQLWVAESILKASDTRRAVKLHKLWCQIAKCCFGMRNFEASASIAGVLSTPSVYTHYVKALYHDGRRLHSWKQQILRSFARRRQTVTPSDASFWTGIEDSDDPRYQAMLGLEVLPTVPCLSLHWHHVRESSTTLDGVPVFNSMDGDAIFSIKALQNMAEQTYVLERFHKLYPFTRDERMAEWIVKMLTRA